MATKQRRRRGHPAGESDKWVPLQESPAVPFTEEQMASIRELVGEYGRSPEEQEAIVADMTKPPELWVNNLYTVSVDREDGIVTCLSIRRNDRKPAKDWRHFQMIKNQIAGEDVEAIELYPRQDRVVDTANQYFLWCLAPGQSIPVGFPKGKLLDQTGMPNTEQRPLPKEWK